MSVRTLDPTLDMVRPTVLEAIDVSEHGFTARWEQLKDAEGYSLDVYTKDVIDPQTDTVDFTDGLDLPDGWKGHDCGSVLETVVADLAAHSQYFYTVTAYAGGLTSLPSDEMAVYTERAGLDSAVTPAFFDVYTLTGTCVLRGATEADVKALPAGLYLTQGRKFVVK